MSTNYYAPPTNCTADGCQCPHGSKYFNLGQFYLDIPSKCKDELVSTLGKTFRNVNDCLVKAGQHQHTLQVAGCNNDDTVRYCNEVAGGDSNPSAFLKDVGFCAKAPCPFDNMCNSFYPPVDKGYISKCTSNDWFTNFETSLCYLTKEKTPDKKCYDFLLSNVQGANQNCPNPNLNDLFKSNKSQKEKSDQCVRCVKNPPQWTRYCTMDHVNKFCHRKAPNGEWDGNLTSPWETRCEGNGKWNILPYPTCFQLEESKTDLQCYNIKTDKACNDKEGCDWGVNTHLSCTPIDTDSQADFDNCVKYLNPGTCTQDRKCAWGARIPAQGYTCLYTNPG